MRRSSSTSLARAADCVAGLRLWRLPSSTMHSFFSHSPGRMHGGFSRTALGLDLCVMALLISSSPHPYASSLGEVTVRNGPMQVPTIFRL